MKKLKKIVYAGAFFMLLNLNSTNICNYRVPPETTNMPELNIAQYKNDYIYKSNEDKTLADYPSKNYDEIISKVTKDLKDNYHENRGLYIVFLIPAWFGVEAVWKWLQKKEKKI